MCMGFKLRSKLGRSEGSERVMPWMVKRGQCGQGLSAGLIGKNKLPALSHFESLSLSDGVYVSGVPVTGQDKERAEGPAWFVEGQGLLVCSV